MDAKLKEYRALRRRKELIEKTKDKLNQSKQSLFHLLVPKIFRDMGAKKSEEVLLMEEEEPPPQRKYQPLQPEDPCEVASEVSELESFEEEPQKSSQYCAIKWSLCAIIWLSFYFIFLKLEFGAVYFVMSGLVGIYLNTRTRPKKRGEVSAYSVFNENCVSIDGTLKAEQFEREIRYGAGSMKIM